MRKLFYAAVAAACLVIIPARALAHSVTVGDLLIGHPWSLPVNTGAPTSAGYLKITNKGAAPDTLVGVETDQAESVRISQTVMQNGMMRMTTLKSLAIAPGQTVVFAPSGYHLMLIKPKAPIAVGGHIYVTLRFARGGAVKADFHVQAAPPGGGEVHAHS